MAGEAFLVAPHARVVDDDRVGDVVRLVVHVLRRVGVDHLDEVAVGNESLVLLVDLDGPVKAAMNRVAAQKARALVQVAFRTAPHDDGPQAQGIAEARPLDQEAREQATDAAEAVEHDVLRLREHPVWQTFGSTKVLAHEGARILGTPAPDPLHRQLAEIDAAGLELHHAHDLEQGVGVANRELAFLDLPHPAVLPEDVDGRLLDDRSAVEQGHDAALAIEAPDDGQRCLGEVKALVPVLQVTIGNFVAHGVLRESSRSSRRTSCGEGGDSRAR